MLTIILLFIGIMFMYSFAGIYLAYHPELIHNIDVSDVITSSIILFLLVYIAIRRI